MTLPKSFSYPSREVKRSFCVTHEEHTGATQEMGQKDKGDVGPPATGRSWSQLSQHNSGGYSMQGLRCLRSVLNTAFCSICPAIGFILNKCLKIVLSLQIQVGLEEELVVGNSPVCVVN